jgi:hypothetical protein
MLGGVVAIGGDLVTTRKGGRKPEHYRGSYQTRARLVRALAAGDPDARCWRCGGLGRADDPWQAGHLVDGNSSSPLMPEHRSCNARAGRRLRDGDGLGKETARWFG